MEGKKQVKTFVQWEKKECNKCKEKKALWEFYRNRKKNILLNICSDCMKKYYKKQMNFQKDLTNKVGLADSYFNQYRKT